MDDNTPMKLRELAEYMRIGYSTLFKYRKAGYHMEFEIRTTPAHFKTWLRDYAAKQQEEINDLARALDLR